MNTRTDRLQRIDTARQTDPTALLPHRLSERELDDHLRLMREQHMQQVDDAMAYWRARPHRRASDNDSALPPEDRQRAAHERAAFLQRQRRTDLVWILCGVLALGYFVAAFFYHYGRYGRFWLGA